MSNTTDADIEKLRAAAEDQALFRDPVPTQRGSDHPAQTGIGELRGFYPNYGATDPIKHGFWYPENSRFHPQKQLAPYHRRHIGVDLYAPYHHFPHEVPVLALFDGHIQSAPWVLHGNAVGNQLNLYITGVEGLELTNWRLLYAHLSRVIPTTRVPGDGKTYDSQGRLKVTKGQVIGYIGISGNVDTRGEATTLESPAGVGSAHLHLVLKRGASAYDPARILPDTLDEVALENYTPPDPLTADKRPAASKWKTQETDPKIPDPTIAGKVLSSGGLGKVRSFHIRAVTRRRRKKGGSSRQVANPPFHELEFDNTRLLNRTLAAYQELDRKLAEDGIIRKLAMKHWKQDLAAYNAAAFKKRIGHTVGDHLHRARQVAAKDHVGSDDRGARAVLAMMHLTQALHTLIAGPALAAAGEHYVTTYKSDWEATANANNTGTWISFPSNVSVTVPPIRISCGIGVQGRLLALAYHDGAASGVIGMHQTRPALPSAALPTDWVYSTSYGTGGLRHATFCENTGSDEAGENGKTLKQISHQIARAFDYLAFLHTTTISIHKRLTNPETAPEEGELDTTLWTQFTGGVTYHISLIEAAQDKLTTLTWKGTDGTDLGNERLRREVLQAMVKANITAFTKAVEVSRKSETVSVKDGTKTVSHTRPAMPSLWTLQAGKTEET